MTNPNVANGADSNEPSEEFKKRLAANSWEWNLSEVIEFINSATKEDSDWTWAMNTRCKYVQLRIDMRDGGFVILDRGGERISFDQLKWQLPRRTYR